MVTQKPSKIQDIQPRIMNFCESTVLCHISLPAKNEQNPMNGSRDVQPAPLTLPPPPQLMHDVRLIVAKADVMDMVAVYL